MTTRLDLKQLSEALHAVREIDLDPPHLYKDELSYRDWTVYGNGQVLFNGVDFTQQARKETYVIDQAILAAQLTPPPDLDLAALMRDLEAAGFTVYDDVDIKGSIAVCKPDNVGGLRKILRVHLDGTTYCNSLVDWDAAAIVKDHIERRNGNNAGDQFKNACEFFMTELADSLARHIAAKMHFIPPPPNTGIAWRYDFLLTLKDDRGRQNEFLRLWNEPVDQGENAPRPSWPDAKAMFVSLSTERQLEIVRKIIPNENGRLTSFGGWQRNFLTVIEANGTHGQLIDLLDWRDTAKLATKRASQKEVDAEKPVDVGPSFLTAVRIFFGLPESDRIAIANFIFPDTDVLQHEWPLAFVDQVKARNMKRAFISLVAENMVEKVK